VPIDRPPIAALSFFTLNFLPLRKQPPDPFFCPELGVEMATAVIAEEAQAEAMEGPHP